MDSEKFSSRNQSIGCAVAWVTIACNSESDCPFNPEGQFCRICAGHLGGSTFTVVVTVKVQLLVPENTVTHLLPFLLTIV